MKEPKELLEISLDTLQQKMGSAWIISTPLLLQNDQLLPFISILQEDLFTKSEDIPLSTIQDYINYQKTTRIDPTFFDSLDNYETSKKRYAVIEWLIHHGLQFILVGLNEFEPDRVAQVPIVLPNENAACMTPMLLNSLQYSKAINLIYTIFTLMTILLLPQKKRKVIEEKFSNRKYIDVFQMEIQFSEIHKVLINNPEWRSDSSPFEMMVKLGLLLEATKLIITDSIALRQIENHLQLSHIKLKVFFSKCVNARREEDLESIKRSFLDDLIDLQALSRSVQLVFNSPIDDKMKKALLGPKYRKILKTQEKYPVGFFYCLYLAHIHSSKDFKNTHQFTQLLKKYEARYTALFTKEEQELFLKLSVKLETNKSWQSSLMYLLIDELAQHKGKENTETQERFQCLMKLFNFGNIASEKIMPLLQQLSELPSESINQMFEIIPNSSLRTIINKEDSEQMQENALGFSRFSLSG